MNIRLFSFLAFSLILFTGINSAAESLETDSVSPGQVSESISSDTVPTEKLEDLTKTPEQVSETVDEANASAEEKINDPNPQQKPLGVREAEGKVIGAE